MIGSKQLEEITLSSLPTIESLILKQCGIYTWKEKNQHEPQRLSGEHLLNTTGASWLFPAMATNSLRIY